MTFITYNARLLEALLLPFLCMVGIVVIVVLVRFVLFVRKVWTGR